MRDAVDAVLELQRLRESAVLGIPEALDLDIADVLADTGGANEAEAILAKANIQDLDVYDVLSATFFEVGKVDDALEISNVSVNGASKDAGTRCRRRAKQMVIVRELGREPSPDELGKLANQKDPVCDELHHELSCWMFPANRCAEFLDDQKIDKHYVILLDAYYSWPATEMPSTYWIDRAGLVATVWPLPGTAEIVVSYLEAALRASSCKHETIDSIRAKADTIGLTPDSPFAARLAGLKNMDVKTCEARVFVH